jgi:folate-binding protein YgfZ
MRFDAKFRQKIRRRITEKLPMPETDLAQNLQATALAGLLESSRTSHELIVYRGVLTPVELDAPETEIAALVFGAAIHDLGWMRRVAVRGADRFRWLSGMVTNTVNDLFPNTGAWNLVLNAQGHIQGDLTVWRGGEESSPQRRSATATAALAGDPLLGTRLPASQSWNWRLLPTSLTSCWLTSTSSSSWTTWSWSRLGDEQVGEAGSETAIGMTGPQAGEVLERVGLPVIGSAMAGTTVEWNGWNLRNLRTYGVLAQHYEFWLPSAGLAKLWSCLRTGGATPIGSRSIEAFRIAEGIPAYGTDMVERDLPQETSQMRALHFAKGCYLGQEIVERIRSRGNVHRHLRPLELSGPAPQGGAELKLEDGTAAGQITSAAELKLPAGPRVFALGMMRSEPEERAQAFAYKAGVIEGTARILEAPPKLAQKRKN